MTVDATQLKFERDVGIVRKVLEGSTYLEVAKEVDLTKTNVMRICNRMFIDMLAEWRASPSPKPRCPGPKCKTSVGSTNKYWQATGNIAQMRLHKNFWLRYLTALETKYQQRLF